MAKEFVGGGYYGGAHLRLHILNGECYANLDGSGNAAGEDRMIGRHTVCMYVVNVTSRLTWVDGQQNEDDVLCAHRGSHRCGIDTCSASVVREEV